VSGRQASLEYITLTPDDHVRVIEERRRAAESVLWQLPSVTMVAQAFLLSAGLDAHAKSSSQIVVGLLGIAAVLGTGLVICYQVLRARAFGDWLIQTVRQPLGPEDLGTEPGIDSRMIPSISCAFKVFCAVCGSALLGFLIADGYVLTQGIGCW
jgi:hypothetical protein